MEFYKIITICVIYICLLDYIECLPTFGDEFVHIKVHVPNEPSNSRGILEAKPPGLSPTIHKSPKVIHHFHRRRRPIKKGPKIETAPLFENILLAELDKPRSTNDDHSYQHDAKDQIEETYLVKEEHIEKKPITKVNTYTVVEETLHKPSQLEYKEDHHYHQPHAEYGKENVETYKVIEDNNGEHHDYHQPKHVETVKLIEEKSNYHYHQQHEAEDENIKYHHQPKYVETIKLIEEKPHYHQQHAADETFKVIEEKPHYHYHQQHVAEEENIKYHYQPKHVETVKLIEEKPHYHHKHVADYDNYDYQPKHVEKHIETVKLIEEKPHKHYKQHIAKDSYDSYHKPQLETIEIVKTKSTNPKSYSKPYQETTYENYPTRNYHREPIKETIEIIKTKAPEKYHYTAESDYNYQQPEEEIIKIKETKYAKPKEEYHSYRDTSETPHQHYSRKPETIIEKHIEYRKPITEHHYYQPADKESYQTTYDTGNEETDYHYHKPSYETQSQKYIPPSRQSATSIQTEFKPSPSYTQYEERPHYKTSYVKSNYYAAEVQPHLPYAGNPPAFQDSYNYQAPTSSLSSSSSAVRQNTLYDEITPSNVDWPNVAENPRASETYTGYDSYSAGHVQGLGSGGYKYPLTYT